MAVQVYRCSRCRREILVRIDRPLSAAEVARRREEEMRPAARGPRAPHPWSDRLRDDIWIGISAGGEEVPRERLPEGCPACGDALLERSRIIE